MEDSLANTASTQLALELIDQLVRTVRFLASQSDNDLDTGIDHVCAMRGGLRRLLVHNIEHERMHAGAISGARLQASRLQESELARLITDLIRNRAEVVGQLLVMDDSLLDAKAENDEWPVRKHIEHLLYWEKDSMAAASRDLGSPRS
jgi:hypothetical protein